MKTLLSFLTLALAIGAYAQKPPPNYHEVGRIAVGGEGGWDYLSVDPDAHRLYVTRGSHVMVVDTVKNALAGDIPNTPGVHGVALASRLGRGFVSCGRENTVLIFDLKTLKEIERVPVGKNPDAILFDAATGRVFTFNGGSNDVTALDAKTGKVLGTIPVGGKPEFAQADGKGTVFVNIEDTSEIVAFDAAKLSMKSRWPITPGEEASGLALDRTHHHLFAVCSNEKMAILDSLTGKVLATPTIGKGPDAASYDDKAGLAFSSNGQDGTLTLIDTKTFQLVGTVPTQRGARTMTLDPKTGKIYTIAAKYNPPVAGERRPSMVPGSATILIYGK
ncbi:MAG: YncE family protein [Armatimonas sp.]